jgi:hypothetical protein
VTRAIPIVLLTALGCGGPTAAAPAPCRAAGTWRDGPLFTIARGGHTATLLPDGMVLLWGGVTNLHVDVDFGAETLDPAGVRNGAGFDVPLRSGHVATLLPDGRVLITGGEATPVIFDPSAAQLTPVTGPVAVPAAPGPPPGAADGAAIARLPDGRVLAAGGHDARGAPRADAAIWDGAAWCATAPMSAPRSGAAAVVLAGGAVLVTGGATDGPDQMDPFIRTTEIFTPAP